MKRPTRNETPPIRDPFFDDAPSAPDAAEETGCTPPGCLEMARARELALDPARWTAREKEHASGCRLCANRVKLFEQGMPHLSLWMLIRRRMGLPLLPVEEHAVRYHLVEGGCRECRERDRRAAALLPNVTLLSGALPAPARPGVHASAPGAVTSASASGPAFDAELALERGRLGLEVRTRDSRWKHQLVGWTLATRRQREAHERFAVLYPDV